MCSSKRLGLLLLLAVQGWGAVAVDATMTAGNSSDGTAQDATNVQSITSTGITVGASATLLVVTIGFQRTSGAGTNSPGSLAVTWNGTAMTAQSNTTTGTGIDAVTVYIFTLVNPAAGAKTISASWTTHMDVYMGAISFTGTDTTTGVKTSDNTTALGATSITVTSSSDGATVASYVNNGATPTTNFTQFWDDGAYSPGGAGSYKLGGTSNSHSFSGGGGSNQVLAGVHVIAGTGGGGGGGGAAHSLTLTGAGK